MKVLIRLRRCTCWSRLSLSACAPKHVFTRRAMLGPYINGVCRYTLQYPCLLADIDDPINDRRKPRTVLSKPRSKKCRFQDSANAQTDLVLRCPYIFPSRPFWKGRALLIHVYMSVHSYEGTTAASERLVLLYGNQALTSYIFMISVLWLYRVLCSFSIPSLIFEHV